MENLYRSVDNWVQANTHVEDPQVTSILLNKDNSLYVSGRSTARDGNYGQRFTSILSYKIEDNKFVVWEKKK